MTLKVMVTVMVMVVMGVRSSLSHEHGLILILVDGFRWDYTVVHGAGTDLLGFAHFQESGARAKYIRPAFPANSFPNWHTIVTGLHPESHGIVGNHFYDPEREAVFNLEELETTADPSWWGDREPLWITTTKHGLDTALFSWSRCDVPWQGEVRPRYCEPYKKDATASTSMFPERLTQALNLLQTDGYKVVMVYEGAVDTRGHSFGPLSAEVSASVREVDTALQALWRDLEARGMADTTNVVLVSDHGMTAMGRGKVEAVEVSGCLLPGQVEVAVNQGGYLTILPVVGQAHKVVEAVRSCEGVGDKVDVYQKHNLPDRYHYRSHRFIYEVIVIAKQGYTLQALGESGVKVLMDIPLFYPGNHGFDNADDHNPDMRGVLYAAGPAFVKGGSAGVVQQVDVYGLLCRALHLPCHPHNGTSANTDPFFAPEQPSIPALLTLALALSLGSFLLLKALKE